MKKIRIGIVGPGNVGMACVEIIKKSEIFELVAVFSKETFYSIANYVGLIDVLLICVGSNTDAPTIVPYLAKNFSTVDSFDNHGMMGEYVQKIREMQKKPKPKKPHASRTQGAGFLGTVSIVGAGWDPGLFSVMRIYFDSIFGGLAETFWGPGVSLGHTNAIKEIDGVEEAIQFTVPSQSAIDRIKKGLKVESTAKHKRVCYVVAHPEKHIIIENEIRTMPNYFDGYDTEVNFVTRKEFNRRFKNRREHGGQVLATDGVSMAEFKLKLKSNPSFTAKVMVAYAIANWQLQKEGISGVFTVADIAPRYLSLESMLDKI